MKIFNHKILKSVSLGLLVAGVTSCSLTDLNVNSDPNNPANAAANLQLANIQLSLMSNLASNEGDASTFMGLMGTQGLSRYDLSNGSYTGLWDAMYQGPLKDLEGLISASQASPHYLGVSQLLKAVAYTSMVDFWGDIPFSEASKGDDNNKIINPKFDKDVDVYKACIALVDEAIANLGKTSAVKLDGDLIYNGSIANWKKAATTVKLKLLMTSRKGLDNKKAIEDLIAAGGFIDAAAEDLDFQFSKDPTSSRHPYFTGAYTGGEFDYTYITHELMIEGLVDEDPRWPFQFRRQTGNILDSADPTQFNTQPCSGGSSCLYGYVVNNPVVIKRLYEDKGKTYGDAEKKFLAGVFGRDRGDADGIPADGTLRTLPGAYPCGGFYDVAAAALPGSDKAAGGGIFPFLTGVNAKYFLIEAMLDMGVAGDAKKAFEDAMKGHIDRVVNFGVATDVNSVKPTADAIKKYTDLWLKRYDDAATNTAKLNVVLKQLWFSSLGNGFEIYNAYRRTGLPTNIQEHIDGTLRGFPLRVPYPQTELTLNPNAAAYKTSAFDKDPIFWDK
jgi:hypothetical protein